MFALLLICSFYFVSADININLEEVNLDDLLIGNEGHEKIVLTSDSDALVKIDVGVSDHLENIATITPEKNTYLTKDVPLILDLIIKSNEPKDLTGKVYLFFETVNKGQITSMGDNFFTLDFSMVPGENKFGELEIIDVSLSNVELGELVDLSVTLNNKANYEKNIKIMISYGDEIKELPLIVPAFYKDTQHFFLPVKLLTGEYFANIIISSEQDNLFEKELKLNVLNDLYLLKKVNILQVYNDKDEQNNYLTTVLDNQGNIPLKVSLEHKIFDKDENLISTIYNDGYLTENKQTRFETILNLLEQGEYSVETVVYYSDTFTDPTIIKFKVTEEGNQIPLSAGIWVIFIGIIVLFLFIKMKKK